MDHLRALRVLCAIADHGGLTHAGKALSLSTPTVARILAELETHLGAPLFQRSTRALRPTETGRQYLADARRILEDLGQADALAQGAQARPTGTLRVTAPLLFGQAHVAPILGEYVERHPGVSVDALFVDRLVHLIEENIDVAVRIGPLPDSGLRAIRLGEVRQVICASPAYLAKHGAPARPDELKHHRIVAFSGRSTAWGFAGGQVVRLSPRLLFSTIGACIALATSGAGVTRALSYQVAAQLEDGSLCEVLAEHAGDSLPVHLLHTEARGSSAKLRAFLHLAVERLRAHPLLGGSQRPGGA